MWKILSFPWLEKCLISPLLLIRKKCANPFCREPANENKQFKKTKTLISNSYLIRQSFYGYHCKSALPSWHGESLEITLTVPLKDYECNSIKWNVWFTTVPSIALSYQEWMRYSWFVLIVACELRISSFRENGKILKLNNFKARKWRNLFSWYWSDKDI